MDKRPLDANGKPDFESIRAIDTDLFNKHLTQLLEGKKGNNAYNELIRCAIGAYCHFKSSYNLARFIVWKKDIYQNKEKLLELLQDESQLTKTIYGLISKDAKICFEMTNHYYYNANLLLYKLCNLTEIEEVVKNYKEDYGKTVSSNRR